jgi:hypothetical protein
VAPTPFEFFKERDIGSENPRGFLAMQGMLNNNAYR